MIARLATAFIVILFQCVIGHILIDLIVFFFFKYIFTTVSLRAKDLYLSVSLHGNGIDNL